MDSFINFLDQYGFPVLTVIVTALLGRLIIRHIIKQLKVLLVASSMDNSLVNFVLTLVKFILLLGLVLLCLSLLKMRSLVVWLGLKELDCLSASIVCFSDEVRFSGTYTMMLTSKSPLP